MLITGYRWVDWNIDHIAEHGVSPGEAEFVVDHAAPPYPKKQDREKWAVRGQGPDGAYLQVVYLMDPDGETAFVIHARPLDGREIRNLRRSRR